jgi:hypothetical protein
MKFDLRKLTDAELIDTYGQLLQELKRREIIRSKNLIGDLGEYLAISYYNATPGLPKLQVAPPGTQNVAALSRSGERYSIKSTTGSVTGVFYGLPANDSDAPPQQKFEYVIVVQMHEDYRVRRLIELSWEQFLQYKKWHSRMQAWNLQITKSLVGNAKVVLNQI